MASYVALYRKYRPATFAELVGQEPIARTLASAIAQAKLGHAYLLCGPRGTGKTTVARILAKSVNCQAGPTADPCGTCSSCREIMSGTNLDVIEIDAASNNGVDNIRDLQDRVALAPVGGRFKIYIIDEVHMLSQGAFNALLKTLEEPPPNVLFVLATTDPHKVLPTIISRCQRFDFGRIPLAAMVGRLTHVAGQEGIAADAGALEAIARRANGGLRDALSLLDQLAASMGGQPLTAEAVSAGLGLVAGDQIVALGDAVVRGDAPGAIAIAQGLLAAGHERGELARELLTHFRHLLVLQLAPERAGQLDVPIAHQEALRAQAAAVPPAELPWMLESLNETEGVSRRSPQQAIWLELGLVKLARRPAIPSLLELADRVAALEAALAGGPAPVAGTAARPPARLAQPAAPAQVSAPRPAQPPEPATVPAAPPAQPPEPAAAVVAPSPAAFDMPPRPPLEVLEGGAPPAPPRPAVEAPAAVPVAAGGNRPVPPGAWDRVHEHVRVKSLPTAALLAQQAAIDRWEHDGGVVIRMGKMFKEQFERTPAKKKLLSEAVVAVFGADAYARLETADPKGLPRGKAPAAPALVAPAAPAAAPAFEAPPPPLAARPSPAPAAPSAGGDVWEGAPLPEEPPAWLDDFEDSRPPDVRPDEAQASARPPATASRPAPVMPGGGSGQAPVMPVGGGAGGGAPTGGSDDQTLRLTVELFNGRVVTPLE